MSHSPRWITLATPFALAAAIWLLHGNVLSGFWRFDDPQMLDFIRHQPLPETLYRPDVWQKLNAPFFTPLLTLSYALDNTLFDLHAPGFYLHHLFSLFLAAWMTTRLLRRWTPPIHACLGSLLFVAGFPVTVVAQQIMTRHYIEGLVFAIAALICFYDSARRPAWAWAGALCYLVAMLAKEVYAPLLFFLLVATDRNTEEAPLLPRLTPYILAATIYVPWRHAMLGGMGGYTTRLIPGSAELLNFISGTVHWGLGGGPLTTILAGIAAGGLLIGIRHRALKPARTALVATLLAIPLLPIMIPAALPEAPGYFIPHRYLFLPWWALSCALAIALAPRRTPPLARRPPSTWIAIACATAFAAAVSYNQHASNVCFRQLINDNERMYQTIWFEDQTSLIRIPHSLLPYTGLMTTYIASIRNLPPERLPRLVDTNEPPGPAARTFAWSYDPKSCGLSAPR